ncbi:MAG: EF-P lysine aminoacylase GenX [Pirellulales bacterium]
MAEAATAEAFTRAVLRHRADLRGRLRRLFDGRGFLEVDTPVLSAEVVPEAHIDPIVVRVDGPTGPDCYLQTSPEAHMKRLLAAGAGPIYQFARSFRAGERGSRHDVEFVLLEWYAPGTTLDDSAALVEMICSTALDTVGIERLDCVAAFQRHAGIDPFTASDGEWQAAAARLGLNPPHGHTPTPDDFFELFLAEAVGPRLGHQRPTLLEGWPVSQAAFARLDPANPRRALRFELFVRGVELANGWEEDPCREELRRRIDGANQIRIAAGRCPLPSPTRLLTAHGPSMPRGVGAALGFDRLAMLAAGAASIDAVRCFTSADA